MKYGKVLIIESLSVEEIQKLNTATKSCATQLKDIALEAKELLSINDYNVLLNSQEILNKIIDKRNVFKKRSEKKIEKVKKIKDSLKTKFDMFNDIDKLTYILAVDIDAFKYFSPTLEEAYDDFLEFSAKKVVSSRINITEFINTIEKSIKTNQSAQLIEEIRKRASEFGLER